MKIYNSYPELMDLSDEFLFVLDSELRVISANDVFVNNTGIEVSSFLSDFISENDGKAISSIFKQKESSLRQELLFSLMIPNSNKIVLQSRMSLNSDDLLVCNASDQSKLYKVKEEMYKIQYFDTLTGLYNNPFAKKWLNDFFEENGRKENYAFISCEFDGLVFVDDIYGYDVGDKVICELASRVRRVSNDIDIIARLTNGTICIIKKYDNLEEYLNSLTKALNLPIFVNEIKINMEYYIGITLLPSDVSNANECLRYTNFAVEMTRQQQKSGGYTYFKNDFLLREQKKAHLTEDLRNAISNDELVLFYQPKIDLKTKELSGFEALIRWQHPKYGLLTPDKFIEIAEEKNIIAEMGAWVIKESFKQSFNFAKLSNKKRIPLKIAINLSVKQLNQNLIDDLKEILRKTEINPNTIEFEVTETLFLGDRVQEISKILHKIREMGFSIAIDDFGTGYSSFFYLKNMDIDTLKIDKSFVKDLPDNTKDVSIAKTIISFAHDLGFTVVA